MISPSDKSYQHTKNIKLGVSKLETPFLEMVLWLRERYKNPNIINVLYEWVEITNCPRLEIVYEFRQDLNCFKDELGNTLASVEKEILDKFKSLVKNYQEQKIDLNDLFVCFSGFDWVAKWEAYGEYLKSQSHKKFLKDINSPKIWKVYMCGFSVSILYKTEKIKAKSEQHKLLCCNLFSKYFKPFDQFNYYKESEFPIMFDSKTNFDKNWGSWFHYYREH